MTDLPPHEAKPIVDEASGESPEQPRIKQAEQAPVAPDDPNSQRAQAIAAEETQTKQQELEERIKRGERWMIFLTGAIAFLGLCSVIVGILQWQVMSGQLGQMESGSKQTDKLVEAASRMAKSYAANLERNTEYIKDSMESTRSDQRAWVGAIIGLRPQELKIGTRLGFGARLSNTGRTPARDL